jgi:hypothetical protein
MADIEGERIPKEVRRFRVTSWVHFLEIVFNSKRKSKLGTKPSGLPILLGIVQDIISEGIEPLTRTAASK